MAEEETLRIRLRTIAETAGADQVRTALGRVQREQASTAVSARGLGAGWRSAGADAVRFAGALTGVQLGLSLASSAGNLIKEGIASSAQAFIDSQRAARATAAAYGEAAASFTRFSVALSAQTGFTKNAILEAALSARTLSDNYGLTIQQTQKLISVSADLARVRGIGVAEAFERVQSAIRGEAEASEFLGLTLNATFLQQNAQNGALRNTFTTLTDVQRAQVVYNEVLRQTEKFQGLAAAASNGLEGSFSRLDNAVVNLKTHLGELGAPVGQGGAEALSGLVNGVDDLITKVQTAQKLLREPFQFDARRATVPLIELLGKLPVLTQPGGLSELPNVIASLSRLGDALNQAGTPGVSIISRQLQDIHDRSRELAAQPLPPILNLADATRNSQDTGIARVRRDLEELMRVSGEASSLIDALGSSAATATQRASLAAENDLRKVLATQNALELAARSSLRTQLEASGTTDPGNRHVDVESLRRLAFLDQLEAGERDLISAQSEQRDIQREQLRLAGEAAQLTLSILPQRQAIAALERQITDQVDRRNQLALEARRIAAEQRAAPTLNALEDTQAAVQRARLVLADRRNQSPDARSEARATIRNAVRNVLPGQELAAFDANQGIRGVDREQRATDLATRAAQNPLQQRQAELEAVIRPQETAILAVRQEAERQTNLANIVAARTSEHEARLESIIERGVAQFAAAAKEPVQVQLVVKDDSGNTLIDELIEANGTAQTPPVIQMSGVRR